MQNHNWQGGGQKQRDDDDDDRKAEPANFRTNICQEGLVRP